MRTVARPRFRSPSSSHTARVALLAVAVAAAGCAGIPPERLAHQTIAERQAAKVHPPGAIVLDSALLVHEQQSNVLEALQHGVPNLLVRPTTNCPILALRQTQGLPESSNPEVYVNGTRTSNTCILENVYARNVAFIEVYPNGVTTRPGYTTSAYGLILLFMRSY